RIASRPILSGRFTTTRRSKRPGLRSALSSTSGWLVAARTMMPSRLEKPSISVKIWFSVCSCSLEPPITTCPRARPIASSSSMKMMAGWCSRACLKRSRTRAHDHLHELGAAHREEGHSRLSSDGLGQQGLPGPWRAHEQHTLWSGAAQPGVLRGFLEKIHDLDKLVLGLVDAGHVGERNFRTLFLVIAPSLALADAHEPAAHPSALLRPPEHPDVEADDEHGGTEPDEESCPGA